MARLDDELWKPTALGTVGPRGVLGVDEASRNQLLYRALEDWNLIPPPLTARTVEHIHVLKGHEALSKVPILFEDVPALRDSAAADDPTWLAVVAASEPEHTGAAYSVARSWLLDSRAAELVTFVFDRPPRTDPLKLDGALYFAMATTLLHELAKDGYVAVLAKVEEPKLIARLTRGGLFQTLNDVIVSHGLAASANPG